MSKAERLLENDFGEMQFYTSTDYIGMERWFGGTWSKESGGSLG
jgi:hypothetical protein